MQKTTVPPCKPAVTPGKVRALVNSQDGTRSALCVGRACENAQLETPRSGGTWEWSLPGHWQGLTHIHSSMETAHILCDPLWSKTPEGICTKALGWGSQGLQELTGTWESCREGYSQGCSPAPPGLLCPHGCLHGRCLTQLAGGKG